MASSTCAGTLADCTPPHVRRDGDDARSVDAVDQPDLRCRGSLDEVADRHRAPAVVFSVRSSSGVETGRFSEASRMRRLIGGHGRYSEPSRVRSHLTAVPDSQTARAVHSPLSALSDVELPVDAGEGEAVVDVARSRGSCDDVGNLLRPG